MHHLKYPLKISAVLCAFALSACNTVPKAPEQSAVVEPAHVPAPVASNSSIFFNKDSTVGLKGAFGRVRLERSLNAMSPSPSNIGESDQSKFNKISDNAIEQTSAQPVSTFSLDVDTSSYANTRKYLISNQLPPPDAVRVEELLNYFPSESSANKKLNNAPFSVDYELSQAPWAADKTLLRVNVQALDVASKSAPAAHLVFLVDVSGSMGVPEKLPLVQKSLKMLTERLRPQDTVSLVTYAGATAVVLEPTSGKNKAKISAAIDQLGAGGGTNGGAGLTLAYKMAEQGYVKGDVNRILLATDGDFNLGVSSDEELKAIVKREREKGITLSTLGFGSGNYNDAMMEQIADVGNGNSSYIDSVREADKVLGDEMSATLITVAKDVKAQLEFNPTRVLEWRQIGYENRQLKREDFNNDQVDAGDIGAGKRITVLYELVLAGQKTSVDPLRYQESQGIPVPPAVDERMDEIGFLKMRWKAPEGSVSELASLPIGADKKRTPFERASTEQQFMGAVAAFGQKLRNNPAVSSTTWSSVAAWAKAGKGVDDKGYRAEFVRMVEDAARLSK